MNQVSVPALADSIQTGNSYLNEGGDWCENWTCSVTFVDESTPLPTRVSVSSWRTLSILSMYGAMSDIKDSFEKKCTAAYIIHIPDAIQGNANAENRLIEEVKKTLVTIGRRGQRALPNLRHELPRQNQSQRSFSTDSF